MNDIFETIINDDLGKVKSIIENDSDVIGERDVTYNMTLLHYAAYYNRPALLPLY